MREVTVRWRGPMTYRQAFYVLPTGLYMVVLGQNPLFIAAARDVSRALGSHLIFRRGQIVPGDMIGRELLSWTNNYRQRLTVKLGEAFDESGKKVVDMPTLEDIVSLVAFNRRLPLNPYGRDACEGTQMLKVKNTGKFFPLDDSYETDPDAFVPLEGAVRPETGNDDEDTSAGEPEDTATRTRATEREPQKGTAQDSTAPDENTQDDINQDDESQ